MRAGLPGTENLMFLFILFHHITALSIYLPRRTITSCGHACDGGGGFGSRFGTACVPLFDVLLSCVLRSVFCFLPAKGPSSLLAVPGDRRAVELGEPEVSALQRAPDQHAGRPCSLLRHPFSFRAKHTGTYYLCTYVP